MTNGCIRHTLREDLLTRVAELARRSGIDYLLIESSGISEPMPVAATFAFGLDDDRTVRPGRVTGGRLRAAAEQSRRTRGTERPVASVFGDRRQELVFIGVGLDTAALHEAPSACLLTDAEIRQGQDTWRRLPEPFPL
jgi:G3E family GTPase